MANQKHADELTRPVRVYADIPQSLDIAIKIHCAKMGVTRKNFLAELIREFFTVPAAQTVEKKSARLN